MKEYLFRVVERGQYAYVLWPWETPESFLYEALKWEAMYKLRQPIEKSRRRGWITSWIEFVPTSGTQGEYQQGLLFGLTDWGHCLYRRFNARSSHYLTQHGLDGLPRKLWLAAYENEPGAPLGDVKVSFRVESTKGAFDLTFYDWMAYFVSGKSGHISNLGITITKKRR